MQSKPELVIMYREVEEAVRRQQALHQHRLPARNHWPVVRAIAGNALIALGTRISPMPRPMLPGAAVQPAAAPGQ
jgi:hypothetical protein